MTDLPRPRPRRLPIRSAAWALSVVAHAALLTWLASHPDRHDWPASMGRRVGALQVRLNERPQDVAQIRPVPPPKKEFAPSKTAATSTISVAHSAHHTPVPLPRPDPPFSAAEVASAASAPEASPAASAAIPPAPATSAPGASFANLFAPFISRPMGRGRWGSPPPSAPPQPSPDLLRQQAVQARRDQLMQSIQWLQTQLDRTPLVSRCQAQITISQTAGAVTCQDPADQNRLNAALSPFLSATQADAIPPEACLSVHERRIQWVSCPVANTSSSASSPS